MDADTYVLDFLALGDRLAAHPNVALTNFYVGDGAPEEAVREAEAALGRPLPPAVRALYRAADGLQLRYTLRDDPAYEPGRYERGEGSFDPCAPYEEEAFPTGCVNVVPLAVLSEGDPCDLGVRGGTDAPISVLDETYAADAFFDRLVLLDHFDPILDAALFSPEGGPAVVLLSGPYHTQHWMSRPIDFESYLRFVLHRAGNVRDREGLAQRPPVGALFRKATWSRFDDHPLTFTPGP